MDTDEHAFVVTEGAVRMLVLPILRVRCLCGCGRIADIPFSQEHLETGGVGYWSDELFEIAIGIKPNPEDNDLWECISREDRK